MYQNLMVQDLSDEELTMVVGGHHHGHHGHGHNHGHHDHSGNITIINNYYTNIVEGTGNTGQITATNASPNSTTATI